MPSKSWRLTSTMLLRQAVAILYFSNKLNTKIALVNCLRRRYDKKHRRLKALKPGRQTYYTKKAEKDALKRALKKIKSNKKLLPSRMAKPHCKAVVNEVFLKEIKKERPRYQNVPRLGLENKVVRACKTQHKQCHVTA